MPTKQEIAARLEAELHRAEKIRAELASKPRALERRQALRSWQAARLENTHADLLADPRFHDTARFFLSDIYGPKDVHSHIGAARNIMPVMTRVLPAAGLETVADAVELNALSESLDAEMVDALGGSAITAPRYAAAYRKVGRRADRERQIQLIMHLGQSLDRLTRKPLVGATLSLMRKPAMLAGLGDLQDFLERGYSAFKKMGGAEEFLERVTSRERALLEGWFSAK